MSNDFLSENDENGLTSRKINNIKDIEKVKEMKEIRETKKIIDTNKEINKDTNKEREIRNKRISLLRRYYRGFFIEEEVGNNVFSYSIREDKKIYVPKIKEGSYMDVEVGVDTAFSEVQDGEELNKAGLKNFILYYHEGVPVYIFDNHNHAFFFWCVELNLGKFSMGSRLIHVDQHKDTRVPENYDVNIGDMDSAFNYTNFTLNVGNFIKPALEKGMFEGLKIIDSEYSLHEFKKQANIFDKPYSLDVDLDFFSEDMSYIDEDKKIDLIRELISKAEVITFATSPFFIDQSLAIEKLIKCLSEK